MVKRKTTAEFIQQAKEIHNNKFIYNKVNYINNRTYIIVICKEHGPWKITPDNHLRGRGCPKCKNKKLHKSRAFTKKEFIEKAKKVHKEKYDYSLTRYINSSSKITIICPKHGKFRQYGSNHLSGKGCSKCSGNKTASKKEFIKKANKIHNGKFTYVNYINSHTKIKIICPKHGEFQQTPAAHLYQRQGCPKCSNIISKPEENWLDSLYIPKENRQVKIKFEKCYIVVDGLDPHTNTIYEFYGDYWHGNPKIYNQNKIHPLRKCSFGYLYRKTLKREKMIKKAGFNLVTIWESDFHE